MASVRVIYLADYAEVNQVEPGWRACATWDNWTPCPTASAYLAANLGSNGSSNATREWSGDETDRTANCSSDECCTEYSADPKSVTLPGSLVTMLA